MELWKNQHMLLTFLLTSLTYTLKLLVEMNNISMVTMNRTTETYTTWLDYPSLIVTNTKINGVVKLKHVMKSIGEKNTVYWTTTHLTLIGMVNVPSFKNS